jgi:hypothetical protein
MTRECVWEWRTVQVDKGGAGEGEAVEIIQPEAEWADGAGFRVATVMFQVPAISAGLTIIFETAKSLEGPAPWVAFQTVTSAECPDSTSEYAVIAYLSTDVDAEFRFFRYIRWRIVATAANAYACFRLTAVFND